MRIFGIKILKLRQRREIQTLVCLQRLEAPPPDPHVITLAYYCQSVEFISSAKCGLLPSKKNKITTVNVLLLLLLQLLHLFFISNSSFC